MLKHSHQMFPRQIYHCCPNKVESWLVVVSCFLGPRLGTTLLGVTGGLYRWAGRCPTARLPTIQFSISQKYKYWELDQPAKYFLLKSSPGFEFQMNFVSRVEVS